MRYSIDEVDRGILRALEQDGRMSFRLIARTLGIAEATVRMRVKRMREAGIVEILAFTDPQKVGPYNTAILFVNIDISQRKAILERLEDYPEISFLATLLGRGDLAIEIVASNEQVLWEFVANKIRVLPGVLSVEISSIIEVHKLRYTLPTSMIEVGE